jgi:flagellar biosynthesis/type III secretory pathway protein FliH
MKNSLAENIVTLPTLTEANAVVSSDVVEEKIVNESATIEKVVADDKSEQAVLKTEDSNNESFSKGYDDGVEKGYQAGFDKGHETGLIEGKASAEKEVIESNDKFKAELEKTSENNKQLAVELEEKAAVLNDLFCELSRQKAEFVTKNQDVLLDVIYEAVCKIVTENIQDDAHIKNTVLSFINSENTQLNYKLEVSSADYHYLNEETNVIKNLPSNFEIVPSEKVLSGYIASSDVGNIDARTDVMLQNFREVLLSHRDAQGT